MKIYFECLENNDMHSCNLDVKIKEKLMSFRASNSNPKGNISKTPDLCPRKQEDLKKKQKGLGQIKCKS